MNLLHNPELRRNLWLEITVQRLLAAPLILALILFAAALLPGPGELWRVLANTSGFCFGAVTVFWGAKQVAESFTDEFAQSTWDSQRASGLTSGQMLVGKMFGGASFAWYVGAWCLAVFVPSAFLSMPPEIALRALIGLVSAALFMQGLAAHSTLLSWRKGISLGIKKSRGASWLFAILVLPNVAALLMKRSSAIESSVSWYGMSFSWSNFIVCSLVGFTGWVLLGAHRALRAELQFRNHPWGWIAFALFLQVYAAGFLNQPLFSAPAAAALAGWPSLTLMTARLALAALIALTFGYCFLLSERKDSIRLSRLLRQNGWAQRIDLIPLWAINFGLAGVTAAIMVLVAAVQLRDWHSIVALLAGSVAVMLFAVRDTALVLWCNLGSNSRRADAAALVYLAVLYLLLPMLMGLLHLGGLVGLVQPWSAFQLPLWVLAALAWAALGLDLLRRRWNERVEALK